MTAPVLAVAGSKSPAAALIAPTRAVADAIPGATFELLDGQNHMVSPPALAPLLGRFFTADRMGPHRADQGADDASRSLTATSAP